MMINIIYKSFYEWFSFNKSIYYIRIKSYEKVNQIANKLLNDNPKSYYGFYILALKDYYIKNYEQSFNYFQKMLEVKKHINYETLNFFISNILAIFQLTKKYELIIKHGEKIHNLLKNKRIKILILKFLSNAYKELKQFKKSLDVILELEKINPKIEGLKIRKEDILKILGNEEK